MPTCPHPQKIKYPSKAAAKAALRDMYRHGRGNPDLGAYQCGDHFHLGHDIRHFTQRIRRALSNGKS